MTTALPDVPGNLKIMLAIGTGPAGVSPLNESMVSSPGSGFSSEMIHFRRAVIASEPEGRSPKETACRVNAIASTPRNVYERADVAPHEIVEHGTNKNGNITSCRAKDRSLVCRLGLYIARTEKVSDLRWFQQENRL